MKTVNKHVSTKSNITCAVITVQHTSNITLITNNIIINNYHYYTVSPKSGHIFVSNSVKNKPI